MRMQPFAPLLTAAALAATLAGCGPMDEGDPAAEAAGATDDTEALRGAEPVPETAPWWRYVVSVESDSGACTGTIIGRRRVLTAAHCMMHGGSSSVVFYRGSTRIAGSEIPVTAAYYYPGITGEDCYSKLACSTDGALRDVAVLELASPIPAGYGWARLPTSVISTGTRVWQVGRGEHDGRPNPDAELRWRTTTIQADYDTQLWTEETTDEGDSGGPILTYSDGSYWVHGVCEGAHVYNFWVDWFKFYSNYSSVRRNAGFIRSPDVQPVRVYENASYGGRATHVWPGEWTTDEVGTCNDCVSSAIVPSGRSLTLYQDDLAGRSWTFTASTRYVGDAANDKTSMIRVR